MSMADVSWGTRDAAWAGQVARHYSEADGKDMYYLYFCSWDTTDSGKQSIGVAVSDSPTGPFTDIGQPLVKGSFTTGESSAWNNIDPTVWIETGKDGQEHRYLAWGNGKFYVCELNEDMISVKDVNGDGKITAGAPGESADIIGDTGSRMGIRSFTEAVDVIERFMKSKEVTLDAYPIVGTQSNHWSHYLSIAACHHKLGRDDECGRFIDRAYYIITHAWIGDARWESDPDYYLDIYREEYHTLGLDEYRPLEI